MTLILGLLTQDFVVLASDRRVTTIIPGRPNTYEDTENKAIFLNGQFFMGYTGLARLGGAPTERWVTDVLGGTEPSDYFNQLATRLPGAVNALKLQDKAWSGHAFLAVGYIPVDEANAELQPQAVAVSNALTSKYGGWVPREDAKITTSRPLANSYDAHIFPVGISPNPEQLASAEKQIRRYRRRRPGRVLGSVQILVELVRRVAAANPGVGPDVSVSILPRRGVGQDLFVPLTRLTDPVTEPTTIYVPSDKSVYNATVYLPAMLSPTLISPEGGEIWTGDDALRKWEEWTVRGGT